MRRLVCGGLVLAMLAGAGAPGLAAERKHHEKERREQKPRHERVHRDDGGPLKWGQHRGEFDGHHLRRVRDKKLEHRYPGLHGYKWRGHGDTHRGFWHRDRYVKDGIVFFDDDDRMAGFGYFHNDVFVFVEEDDYHEERGDMIFLLLLMRLLEMQD